MKRPKLRVKKLAGSVAALFAETQRIYLDNEMSVYAGYTTLYILMAMVPLLTLLIGVVNLLPEVSLQHLESVLRSILPNVPEVRSTLHSIIANVNRRAGSLAVSVSLAASLWSASNGINALQLGLSRISGRRASLFQRRAWALLYTLLFVALIPALLIFKVLRGAIEEMIISLSHLLHLPDFAWRVMDFMDYSGVITVVATAAVILLAYTYLQGERRRIGFQLPGALFTTVLWLAFSSLFESFITRFWQASSLYGSLASIFLAAMWLKTITMILFYGAALNEALNRRRGLRPSVSDESE